MKLMVGATLFIVLMVVVVLVVVVVVVVVGGGGGGGEGLVVVTFPLPSCDLKGSSCDLNKEGKGAGLVAASSR